MVGCRWMRRTRVFVNAFENWLLILGQKVGSTNQNIGTEEESVCGTRTSHGRCTGLVTSDLHLLQRASWEAAPVSVRPCLPYRWLTYLEDAGIIRDVLCLETSSLKQVHICKCSTSVCILKPSYASRLLFLYPNQYSYLNGSLTQESEHTRDGSSLPHKCVRGLHWENGDEF